MEVRRNQVERVGADGARWKIQGAGKRYSEMGKVTAHTRPIDERPLCGCLGIADARPVVDMFMDPIEDREYPIASPKASELARGETDEKIGRAIAASG